MSPADEDWLKRHLLESLQDLRGLVGQVTGKLDSIEGEMVGRITRLEKLFHEYAVGMERRLVARSPFSAKDLPWGHIVSITLVIGMALLGFITTDDLAGRIADKLLK